MKNIFKQPKPIKNYELCYEILVKKSMKNKVYEYKLGIYEYSMNNPMNNL